MMRVEIPSQLLASARPAGDFGYNEAVSPEAVQQSNEVELNLRAQPTRRSSRVFKSKDFQEIPLAPTSLPTTPTAEK